MTSFMASSTILRYGKRRFLDKLYRLGISLKKHTKTESEEGGGSFQIPAPTLYAFSLTIRSNEEAAVDTTLHR